MKNICKSLFLLLFPFVSSCSSEALMPEISNVADEEIVKMTAVLPDWNLEDGNSRTSITTGSYPTTPNPVWVTGDSIGIYPDEGDQLSFRIPQGGGKECIFDGGGWAMKASSSYTAYSPFNRSYYYKEKNKLPISMLGQTQKGNDNTDHLGAYDIQIAKGDKPEHGSLQFEFERKVALVRMELIAPKAARWISVTLESDALFTTEANMNLVLATPTVTSKTQTNSVKLLLENVETTSENLDIIAYMMLLPVNLTGKYLIVNLTDSDGNVYKSKARITNDKTNFAANAARWVTASDFVLYEKPDYSWYTSSSASTYDIKTAGQFLAFAKMVNGDEDALAAINSSESSVKFSGKTIYLKKDISLAAYCGNGLGSWEPISGFEGVFDGLAYTISDLYCNHSGSMGLFGELNNATIRNLTVEGEITRTIDGTEGNILRIGGVATFVNNTTFVNCSSNVNITIDGYKSPISGDVGGLCAYANNSIFIGCQSSSAITDDHGPLYTGFTIGGLVGDATNSNSFIACCKLKGFLDGGTNESSYVGGIVGYATKKSEYKATLMVSCYTSINMYGRLPGLIVGALSYDNGHYDLNATACYYSGSGSGMNGKQSLGIGTNNYGGGDVPYDSGTARSSDLDETIAAMNAAISTWNSENPGKQCYYKYVNENNNIKLVSGF